MDPLVTKFIQAWKEYSNSSHEMLKYKIWEKLQQIISVLERKMHLYNLQIFEMEKATKQNC